VELCKAAVTSAAFPAGWRACLERSTCKTMRLSAHSHSEEIRMVCLRQRMIENLRMHQLGGSSYAIPSYFCGRSGSVALRNSLCPLYAESIAGWRLGQSLRRGLALGT